MNTKTELEEILAFVHHELTNTTEELFNYRIQVMQDASNKIMKLIEKRYEN